MTSLFTHGKRFAGVVLFFLILMPAPRGFAESLKDGVILRDNAKVFLKDGSVVACHRIVWLVSAADYVQCDKGDHAVEVKLDDLDFEKTFGQALAREYAAMKGDLAEEHEESRRREEAETITYGPPSDQAQEPDLEAESGWEQKPDESDVLPAAAGGDAGPGAGSKSVDAAVQTLRGDAGPVKAYEAAGAIAKLARAGTDCSRAIEVLMERLDDDRPVNVTTLGGGFSSGGAMRRCPGDAAKYALVSIGGPAVPALLQRVREIRPSDWGAGDGRALVALGEIGDPRAVEGLTRYAQQRGAPLQRTAVRSLARIKGPEAWQGLVDIMGSQDGYIRLEAAWGLRTLDQSRAGEAIDPYIDAMIADPDGKRKRSALNLAGDCGLKRLAPTFVLCLDHRDYMVVRMALGALAKVGAPADALPRLLALAREERQKDRATRTIRTISDPAALQGLIAALSHTDPKVRHASACALGRIGDGGAVPALARALEDSDRDTRFAALDALGKFPGPEATGAIREASYTDDVKFRMMARGLLKNRGE